MTDDKPVPQAPDQVHDKVVDHTRLQLSALFDGELALDEARFLQRRLQHDPELGECVSRWQLAGDVLRGQATAAAPAGFARRVAAAVAADAGQDAAPATVRRSRRLWGSGAALAASVAVVALFMARQAPDALTPADAPRVGIASTVPATPQSAPGQAAPQQALSHGVPQAPDPTAPDPTAQFAAASIAVAEVPRRIVARRSPSRAQSQRAAATRASRALEAASPPQFAVAAAAPATPAAATANPFDPSAARPWPRALLPNAGTAFNVGYGSLQRSAIEPPGELLAHPFQPRPAALQREVQSPGQEAGQQESVQEPVPSLPSIPFPR